VEERLLIKKAKKGDTESFSKLYEKIYKKMYQYALYTLRSEQDAEDVVSDTVVEAFEKISALKKDEAFNAWIFRILSSKCKQKMRDYYAPEEAIEEGVELPTRDLSRTVEMSIDIQAGMELLDRDERQIICMHVISGYKTREIADILEMNENTVRSKESRGLHKLGAILKDWRLQ